MATDYSQMSWEDLMALVDGAQKGNGNGYADTVNIPGLGLVNVSRSNGAYGDSRTGVSGIQLDDPSRGGKGGGWQLGRGEDGSITRTPYEYKTSFIDYLPAIGAAAVVGGGLSGAFEGLGATGASGTSSVPWTSGYDLAGGAALPTGSSAAAGAAPAWISAEGGAGYAGGAAADAVTGNAFTNALASASKFMGNPLVQAGASLLSGVMSSRAASKAADTMSAASDRAAEMQQKQYEQTRTDLAPWRDRGGLAANRMAVMMGLSGDAKDPNYGRGMLTSPQYQAPTQNRLSQMLQVLNQRVRG